MLSLTEKVGRCLSEHPLLNADAVINGEDSFFLLVMSNPLLSIWLRQQQTGGAGPVEIFRRAESLILRHISECDEGAKCPMFAVIDTLIFAIAAAPHAILSYARADAADYKLIRENVIAWSNWKRLGESARNPFDHNDPSVQEQRDREVSEK